VAGCIFSQCCGGRQKVLALEKQQENQNDVKSFASRFGRLLTATGANSDSEFARRLGLTQGGISAAKKRGQIPAAWIEQVAEKYNVSADWLFFGDRGLVPPQPELVMVKKVVARLCAGNGSLEVSDEVEGQHAFRADWILRKGNPARMVLMDVTGDSMSPVIEDGDTVLIDESKTDVFAGKIYAVAIDDEILVKYIDKIPGKYLLRSKNTEYEQIEIDIKREDIHFRVIGRVLWWCREIR